MCVRRTEEPATPLQEAHHFLTLLVQHPGKFKRGIVRHYQPHVIWYFKPPLGLLLATVVPKHTLATVRLVLDGLPDHHDVVLRVSGRGHLPEVRIILSLKVDNHYLVRAHTLWPSNQRRSRRVASRRDRQYTVLVSTRPLSTQ